MMLDASWLCASISLVGSFLLAKHRRAAIVILLVASLTWIGWAAYNRIWSLVVLNSVFVGLNARVVYCWYREKQSCSVESEATTGGIEELPEMVLVEAECKELAAMLRTIHSKAYRGTDDQIGFNPKVMPDPARRSVALLARQALAIIEKK